MFNIILLESVSEFVTSKTIGRLLQCLTLLSHKYGIKSDKCDHKIIQLSMYIIFEPQTGYALYSYILICETSCVFV